MPSASFGLGAAPLPAVQAGVRSPARSALAAILAGALMLMAATLVIGRPGVFTDSDDYYAQGKSVVRVLREKLFEGRKVIDWSAVRERQLHGGQDEEPVHNQDGARSAYYGLALYALDSLGSLWLLAFAQAACAAALIWAFWRAAAPRAPRATYGLVMGALAVATTLPAFTGFAMPDVFAGFAALAMVLLMVYPDRFGWGAQVAIWAFLAAAMNFHLSNVMTALGMLAVSAPALLCLGRPPIELLKRALTVAAAAAVAIALSQAYGQVVELRSGDRLGHPPFLTARVLADGPGRTFLTRACRTSRPFLACDFKWLPLDDSEDILWSDDPSRGIFNYSDFHVRDQLELEDFRFAWASIRSDPLAQVLASTANWGRQIVNTRLDEPLMGAAYYLHDGYWKTTHLPKLILGAAPWCGRTKAACPPAADPEIIAVLDGMVAIFAAGLILRRLASRAVLARARAGRFEDPLVRAGLAAGLILVAFVVNALVCGALSGPFPRYQARVLWLIPAAALILEIVVRSQPGRRWDPATLAAATSPT